MKNGPSYRVLVAAHDLGGANQLIFSVLGGPNGYSLTGPAAKVGEALGLQNLPDSQIFPLTNFQKVIVSSNLNQEKSDQLLQMAIDLGVPTVGYLDHWVDYKSRWTVTPNKIVVTDIYALFNAFINFGFRVRINKNYYLKHIRHQYQSIIRENLEVSALFIIQPIEIDYIHIAEKTKCVCKHVEIFLEKHHVGRIVLRDHVETNSSECLKKLSINYKKVDFLLSDWMAPLETDIYNADFVIGLDTYAMYIARKLGKRVMSTGKRRRFLSPFYRML